MSVFYSWWTKARLMLLHPRDIIRAQSSTEITHQVPRLHTFSLTLWLGFFSWDISFLMHQCSSMPRQHFLSKSLQNVQFLLQNFWHTLLQKDRRWFLSSSLLRVGLWKCQNTSWIPSVEFLILQVRQYHNQFRTNVFEWRLSCQQWVSFEQALVPVDPGPLQALCAQRTVDLHQFTLCASHHVSSIQTI